VASIQNPYNLLNRSFEVGLAEIACREDTGLLAYSPLAFGRLTNKYLHGAQPTDGRLTRYTRFTRYNNTYAINATDAYAAIAEQHGLSLAQMALAFTRQQFFVTSTIIGATTLEQLTENIDSLQIQLDAAVLSQIEAIHMQHPNPAP
jgi:aryl-alcohol dehydrogenase-like predicted oxidoreductase